MSGRATGADSSAAPDDAALLAAIFDSVPACLAFIDEAQRCRIVNRAFLDLVGLPADAVIGRAMAEIAGPAIPDDGAAPAERLRAGETVHREGWCDTPAKGRRYLRQTLVPLCRGVLRGVLAVTQDCTEPKRQEEDLARQVAELRAGEALNAAVFSSALDCVIVIDEEGRAVEFNPAAEVTFGLARAEVLGQPIGDLIVPPALRHRHAEGFKRYLATGQRSVIGRRIEVEGLRRNGEIFPLELAITEVRLPDRRLFTAYLRDLTPARRAADEIEQQRGRLHQMEKLSAMGSLLAGVAHELNNPLAILIAQATLLRDKAPTEDTRRRAERIHAAAERSGRIVKSFVAMARQKPPHREAVDLNEVVRSAAEMTAYGRRSAGIAIDLRLAPDLPPVHADRDLLGQVAVNLLINAVQALLTWKGARQIEVATAAGPGAVILTVADSGPGVPVEIRERIFEPYFTTKPMGAGTGIGLSISGKVIGSHDGRIAVEDRPGGGALFRIVLPTGDAPPTPEASEPEAERGLSVLVIDDEVDVARSVAEILQDLGHRTHVLDNAADALAALGRTHFDAIFVDLRMPGLSGIEFRERVALSHPALAQRTVVVTGDTVAGAEAAARRAGETALVLEKPFTRSDIVKALRAAVERTAH